MADLSFRSTLKPLEVEEVIDLLVHRPLAYLIARVSYPTAVTPDQLTWCSMALGIAAGAAAWSSFVTGHPRLGLAGLLFIASAVVDCSDGQLARMRRSSSAYGRMLDGAVDSIVQAAVIPAIVAHLWWKHGGPSPATVPVLPGGGLTAALGWLAVAVVACGTGLAHTTLYDHFKNVYLHNTQPERREGDDPEEIDAAWELARARGLRPAEWLRFVAYRVYLRHQGDLLRRVDPYVPPRFRDMPAYSPEGAARFRGLHRSLMRAWSFYGIGTHIFVLGVAMVLDRVEVYVLLRLVAFNLGLVFLIPAQRRASLAYFGDPA